MQTIFEAMGGTYQQEGDYLFPNIEVPESPAIGIWGQRRLQYLRTSKRALYTVMLMGDKLKNHLEEVDQSAERMFNQLIVQMKAQEEITEELKANNQLEWVQRMNAIHHQVEEILLAELVFA